MEDDYEGGGYGGGVEADDMYDDIHNDGNRDDLDQNEGMEGIEGGESKVEILTDAPAPQAIDKSKRITTRYMTKYERARVLGTRALQIR
jgi:DNA-directed RNA polymerases I, II, and III subunit RPABC2